MKYVYGNLIESFLKGDVNIIAHQCNTTVGMGAGFAKQIVEIFPHVYELDKGYRNTAKYGQIEGTCLYLPIGENKEIFNLYAQRKPGSPTSTETFEKRINWLKKSINNMKEYLDERESIAIPLIGSGLAKDKSKFANSDLEYFQRYIEPEIEPILEKYDVTVFYV